MSWRFTTFAQGILSGAGAIEAFPEELRGLGVRRVFLLASSRAGRSNAARLVQASLSDHEIVGSYLSVREHAPVVDIETIAAEVRAVRPDALIAIGGGSSGDTAKAVSARIAGLALEVNWEAFGSSADPTVAPLPVVTVPTTLAGAEFAPGGAITDSGVKRFFAAPGLAARLTVYDPAAIADTPREVLISTGMNGLAHCLEAVYAERRSPLTDIIAREGAVRFVRGMLSMRTGDRSAENLESLQYAAILGGLAISHAGAGVHHAVCHVLGGAFGLPHGVANAIVLPFALAFNEPFSAEQQRWIAAEIASELDASGVSHGPSLPEMMAALQSAVGMPTSLRDVGLTEVDLERLGDEVIAREPGLGGNPRPVTREALREFLVSAWAGQREPTIWSA